MEDLIICTTQHRARSLHCCLQSFSKSADLCGAKLSNKVYTDHFPVRGLLKTAPSKRCLEHLVAVRNRAFCNATERWAFLCDDDDFVYPGHVGMLLFLRSMHPLASVIMTQACTGDLKKPLGFTISCSLVNVDRFRMVNWLLPPSGGEDAFTLSTLEIRGHQIVRDPHVTWQVCDDVPSLTRMVRVELQEK